MDDDWEFSPFIYHMLALLRHPFGILRRRWIWMLLALVVGLSGTVLLYVTRVPTYEASATVIVSGQQIPEEFVRSTVFVDLNSNLTILFIHCILFMFS